jgi:hypothetical protein
MEYDPSKTSFSFMIGKLQIPPIQEQRLRAADIVPPEGAHHPH